MSLPPDALRRAEAASEQLRARQDTQLSFVGDWPPEGHVAPYVPPEGLNTCANPECCYLVPRNVAYCCMNCGRAHEMHYEIHEDGLLGHGPVCARRPR